MNNNVLITLAGAVVSAAALAACSSTPKEPPFAPGEVQQLLNPIMVRDINIVEPFTGPRSFDENQLPDGLELVFQPLDAYGEPTKIAGHLVVELYAHQQAAPDPKGALLETWRYSLASAADQESYWNRHTQTYELPLAVTLTQPPTAGKYVVVARYTNPWNEHIEDQVVLDVARQIAEARAQLRGGGPQRPE